MAENIEIKKVDGKSLDIEAVDKEKLKAIFPQCFSEGKLDIDKLLSLCGEYIDNDFEKYKFEWKGKSKCYKIAGKRSTGTLRPCVQESVDFENTNNLYIEGDNLEVLKLLQTAYYRKVKMIYIDPPYNTGNDFVYEDDFKDPIAKYKEVTSQTTKSNPETMGRYHTNWLNMMYPRLRLASNLLRDDGVIFISIDDNEIDNLKKLCNEVFGEENFITQFPRVTKKAGKTTDTVAKNNDYVICYVKSPLSEFRKIEHTDDGFSGIDEYVETRGKYKLNQTLDYGSIQYSPSLDYEIQLNGEVFIPGNVSKEEMLERQRRNPKSDFCWRWSRDLFEFGQREGFVVLKDGKNGKRLYTKTYQNATIIKSGNSYKVEIINRTKSATSLDFLENFYSNDNAKKDLLKLFVHPVFDYSKPVSLIKQLAFLTTLEDDIILDFFSGSATTAHAVMQLNAEDGGKRQFIMVQLPEVTDEKSEAFKAGYKNICEIGKERIRRAGAKIKAEHPEVDTGFKVFKLDTSNLVKWDDTPILDNNTQDLFTRMNNMVESIKTDRTELDVVYEVMLKLGIPVPYKIFETQVNGRKVYSIGEDGLVLVCLDKSNGGITPEDITAMCDLAPAKIVAAENTFKDDIALSNAYYISKDKGIEIELL